jgi:hypothetical protein
VRDEGAAARNGRDRNILTVTQQSTALSSFNLHARILRSKRTGWGRCCCCCLCSGWVYCCSSSLRCRWTTRARTDAFAAFSMGAGGPGLGVAGLAAPRPRHRRPCSCSSVPPSLQRASQQSADCREGRARRRPRAIFLQSAYPTTGDFTFRPLPSRARDDSTTKKTPEKSQRYVRAPLPAFVFSNRYTSASNSVKSSHHY